jgi:hypothetical protein
VLYTPTKLTYCRAGVFTAADRYDEIDCAGYVVRFGA